MKRKAFLSKAGLVLVVLASLWLAGCTATVTTQLSPAGRAVTSADCKDGGWRQLTTRHGKAFKNQGECVSYFAR